MKITGSYLAKAELLYPSVDLLIEKVESLKVLFLLTNISLFVLRYLFIDTAGAGGANGRPWFIGSITDFERHKPLNSSAVIPLTSRRARDTMETEEQLISVQLSFHSI